MRKLFCVLLAVLLMPGAEAWGAQVHHVVHAKAKKVRHCTFPKSRKRAPAWVCNGHARGLAVTAVGFAPRSRAGIAHMEQMALADARAQLVEKVRASVQARLAGDESSAAKERLTRITDANLYGTRIEKRANGPHGSLYVLVGLDRTNADRLVESVTEEYRAQQGH
jgi:hypothetical protein